MRAFLAAARAEVLALSRTSEVYTLGVLPATLGVPVLLAVATVVVALRELPEVAIPAGSGLVFEDHVAREVSDPLAVFEAHDVDVAVLSWTWRPDGGADLDARWRSASGRAALLADAEQVVRDALDARVRSAGGVPERDRRVARVPGPKRSLGPKLPTERILPAYGLLGASYFACFLVPVRTTTEKASGVLELVAVARAPLVTWLAARVAVAAVLASGLVALPVLGLLAILGADAGGLVPAPWTALDGFAATLLVCAAYGLVGAMSTSSRIAFSVASSVVMVAICALAVGFAVDLPLVPFAGLGQPDGVAARLAGELAGTGVLLGLAAAWLARDNAVLPPAGGDA